MSFCGLQAASLCAFEVLTAFLEQVEPTGDEAAEGSGEAVQAEYREARSMVYGVRATVGYLWLCAAMLTLPHARTAVSPACRPQYGQPLHACPAAQAADTVLASRTSRVVGCCTQCWVGLTQVA